MRPTLASARAPAALALAAALSFPSAAPAQEGRPLVVVELFTSQGCTACPPADEMIGDLADRVDVMPLSLHVDYWDYIGWADTFAHSAFTERQHGYGRAAGSTVVYTPQMIVGGADVVVGYRPMDLAEQIQAHLAAMQPVRVEVSPEAGGLAIRAIAEDGFTAEMLVQLVRYMPHAQVDIARGERAGTVSQHYNVVTEWQVLGAWDGAEPYRETVARPPEALRGVVIVQEAGYGPIYAAARLE